MKKTILPSGAVLRRVLILLACATASLHAQTTWTAGSSADLNWSNATNWSAAEPTLSSAALFPTPIPNPGSLPDPSTILLSSGEVAQSLTFNASGYILSGGTLQLAAPGNITVTTSGHSATINSMLTGTSGLTKLGAGTLILGGANDLTGTTRVLEGALTIASGGSLGVASASADSLQIAERSTATLTVQSGGQLQVGSGASSFLHVGSRGNVAGSAATVGTLDLSAVSSFTANVGEFHIGVGTISNAGTTRGIVNLATSNTITAATSIIVGDMVPALDNATVAAGTSQLNFGAGSNNVETPLFIVGGSRSRGSVTLAAGGTLTLDNDAGATTLHIGRNAVESTATTSEGTMNLSEGTFIASLDELIIGARITGAQSNTGVGVGTLTMGSSALNNVTAASLVIGSLGASGGSVNVTQGTLNFGGGAFSVSGDVTMANYTASGGLVRGTLNVTGGTFTVGGNILKTAHVSSTSVITVDGGMLDMTDGSITSSQLVWRGGSITNVAVAGVTLDANSATTGQGNAGDALIFRDMDVNFAVSLTGASGGNVHYEAGSAASGATISGNINLGSAVRGFNIEDNTNAAIDTNITSVISGIGGINKTGAGILRLGNANTHSGATTVGEGMIIAANALALQNSTVTLNIAEGLQFASGITDFTFGSLAGNATGTLVLEDAVAQAVNLTVGGNNATSTYSGTISGDGTLVKTGTGILTLSGSAANTYSGLTTVNNGVLLLNKSTGVRAIAGNISLIGGGDLRFGGTGQLASTTQITINGNHSTFNGTGSNAGPTTINETFATLTVIRGVVNAGFVTSQLTVTGASSFTGTTGTTKDDSTMYIGNSGSSFSTGSLSLTDMTGAGGTESANSFTVFGNSDIIQTILQVGAGGLTLNNSNLYLNKGTSANTLGSRLVLDDDITVNGASPSAIITNSGSIGQSEIELSSTAGNVTRVIETNADLSINPDINNGAATLANLTKTGAGKLTLSGTNSYNGHTQVDSGTLSITSSASLGDASATNTLGLASGTTLQYTGAGIADLTASRGVSLGSGAFTVEVTQSSGELIISGALTGAGTGAFTKTGTGMLSLTGGDLSGLNGRGLTLDAGALNFQNNTGIAVALGSGVLNLADQTTLFLEVGSLANYDRFTSTAAATVAANATIKINVTALAGMTANTTYDLISAGAGSGFNDAGLTWQLSLAGDFKFQLNTTDTAVQLQTLDAVTGDAYWRGDIDGSWSSIILGGGNNTNWNTDLNGEIDREVAPGTSSTVYFSASSATGPTITTTLDNDFTINDIVFLASPSGVTNVTIAQGTAGTLTFTPADSAKGVTVQDNAGAISITAPVALGAAQTWNVSATGASLAVSGSISGADAASLTKTGAGTLTLSGANTYTGRTIINAGTIAINAENRLGSNPAAFAADQLTLNGGTLQSSATFAIDDVNRGITLGAGGGTFNTNASTTLTVSSVIAGSGNLTKSGGTGTLTFTKANTYTGSTTVLAGTLRIASGGSIGVASATAGSLQIGDRTTATLTVDAGGSLKVGSGASSTLYVGTRTTDAGTAATVGTLNMSDATSFTANVGKFYIGVADTASASGTTRGIVTLAQNNTITASTEILVGQMTPALANQGVVSELNFGSGINNITTPTLTIGSRKSAATSTIAVGGVLNLANGAGKTSLYLGRNNNSGTSTNASGSLDLTNGTFNATLGTIIVGERSDSSGAASDSGGTGTGTGVLTLGSAANNVTADSLTLGNLRARGSTTIITKGTLNMAGGTFAVSGDVGIGNNTSAVNGALAEGVLNLTGGAFTVGGNVNIAIHTTSSTGTDLSKGTLNITGGAFTVDGNITTSNKTTSTSIVTLDGGTLDMTAGSIDVDTFNAQSGALKDVSEIFNGSGSVAAELNKTTAGTLVMSGTNSYTGATTVTAGVLEVQGTSGSGATTVKTTATLAGAGIIQSTTGTLVESGGTLKAGNNLGDAIGTLTFNSSLELQAGSNTVFQLSGATGTAVHPLSIDNALLSGTPGNHDHLDITGSLTLGSTTTFDISLVGYTAGYGDVFNLIDWTAAGSAIANGFDPETGFNFDLATLDGGLAWETDRFLADGIIYVVPEPSRGLLLLSGMILCLLRRRR
ncbi:MAG: autotransporter-associated beta strand repeat-containing protein [Prosthecobacter sp.]|nr:autotransporter-associated beta strand repeat-containing protein [Prosthecobacter sp.]